MKKILSSLIPSMMIPLLLPAQAPQWRQFYGNDLIYSFRIHYDNIAFPFNGGIAFAKLNQLDKLRIFNAVNSDIPSVSINGTIMHPNEDEFWLSTDDHGIIHYQEGEWTYYPESPSGNRFYISSPMEMINDSTIWFHSQTAGGSRGVFQLQNGILTELPFTQEMLAYQTRDIKKAPDGSVWINNYLAVLRYDGNEWTTFSADSIGVQPHISGMSVSPNGEVYVFSNPLDPGGSGLNFFQNGQWVELPLPPGYTRYDFLMDKIQHSSDGRLWLPMKSQHNAVMEYDGAGWTMHHLADMGLSGENLYQFQVDDEGRRWMLYGWKLYVYHQGILEQALPANCEMPGSRIDNLTTDHFQNKWMTNRNGIVKFDGLQWQLFPYAGIPEMEYAEFFSADPQGNIWYYYNVNDWWVKFDGAGYHLIPMTGYGGNPPNQVMDHSFDPAGRLWVALGGPRVAHFDGQNWQYSQELTSTSIFFPFEFITSIAADPEGYTWCIGEQLHRFDGAVWERQPVFNPYGSILQGAGAKMFAGRYGLWIWKPYDNSVLFRLNGTQWEAHPVVAQTPPDQHATQSILYGMEEDSRGNTWVASSKGLFKYDGNAWTRLHAMNSNLPHNLIYSISIDRRDNIWCRTQAGHLFVYNENGLTNIGTEPLSGFSGIVYFDVNDNGIIDAGDMPLPNQRVWNASDDTYAFSNAQGLYRIHALPGTHDVQIRPMPGWIAQGSIHSYEVQLDTIFLDGFDFLVKPADPAFRMEAQVSTSMVRCNTPARYWIKVQNVSLLTGTAHVQFSFDPRCQYIGAWPAPDEIESNTLVWHAANLPPYGNYPIFLDLLMPDEQATGDTIFHQIAIEGFFEGSTSSSSDTSTLAAEVRCAYDPNDKLVIPEGYYDGANSSLESPLLYTVRFQNTGNDTAYTVIIIDTLDHKLDMQTFELIDFSHPVRTILSAEGIVQFIFENIYLPDSTTDFNGSQGFVKYRIRGDNLPLPFRVRNTAQIYFDFNAPIVTNTTENWLVELLTRTHAPQKPELPVKVMPNPAKSRVLIASDVPLSAGTIIRIFDANGKLLLFEKRNIASQTHEVDLSALAPGTYFVQIVSEQGSTTRKIIKM